MTKNTHKWLLALCIAFGLTAATEAVFLYQLTQANKGLLQWVAVLIVTHEEDHKAVEICEQAREYCENTRGF